MKQLRDLGLIAALFAVLIGFTIWGPGRGPTDTGAVRASTHSVADEGSRALQLWLDGLGYRTANLEPVTWQLPSTTDAMFMLSPSKEPLTRAQTDSILHWVKNGGTLISIVEQPARPLAPNPLWSTLGATVVVSPAAQLVPSERATAAQPVFTAPPVDGVSMPTGSSIALADPDPNRPDATGFVTLLQTRFGPTLVGSQYGRGYIFLGASAQPFTNAGLRQPGSGALVLNLLDRVPARGYILFDEFHHGFHTAASGGAVLASAWWGWAVIYTLLVLALYLILTGKRFGRPVVLRQETARRSSAEYVASMAQLFRQAGKRDDIAAHYHTQLKRRLAQPYGFVPPSDDEQFIAELVRWGQPPADQIVRLRTLLAQLHHPGRSDARLLALARSSVDLPDRRGQSK